MHTSKDIDNIFHLIKASETKSLRLLNERFDTLSNKFSGEVTKMELNFKRVFSLLQKIDDQLTQRENKIESEIKNKYPLKPIHIFLIDEDEDDLIFFEIALSDLKIEYMITHAKSGDEGLRLIASEMPHLLLIDIALSGLNGIEILKIIKQTCSTLRCKVILFSSSLLPEHVECAATLDAICLSTPNTINDFKNLITLAVQIVR